MPPQHVLHARRDRKRVYWAVINGEPTLKGADANTDVPRLLQWDVALEALDRLARADDLEDLELHQAEAMKLVRLLALDEGWDLDANALLDEVQQTYQTRKEALERREVTFTDTPHRIELSTRPKARYAGDLEAARVHEVIRWLRSCRTQDDLLDVAAWIRRHHDEFTEAALACLRKWFVSCRAELHIQS